MNQDSHIMKNFIFSKLNCLAQLVLTVMVLSSCNQEWPNKLPINTDVEPEQFRINDSKVLYIVIEGGVGVLVGQQATDFGAMPTMGELVRQSMYTWNGVSSAGNDEATTYADLLTGVDFDKHGVVSTNPSNNLDNYPTVFKRLRDHVGTRTALFTSNPVVSDLVENEAVNDLRQVANDAEVAQALVAELSNSNAGFAMATFSAAEDAGNTHGFGSAEYASALRGIDQHISQAIDAIHSRPNYSTERWMVVVTSNRGGNYPVTDDGTVHTDPRRNTFTLLHHKQFDAQIVERIETVDPAWMGVAPVFAGASGYALLPAVQATALNFGQASQANQNQVTAGEYTITFKFKAKTIPGRNGTPPQSNMNGVILGKMENAQNFPAGWAVTYNGGNGWRFVSNSSTSSNWGLDSEVFELNEWYTLTIKIYNDGITRRVKTFRNGILKSNGVDFNARNMSSNVPFQVGFQTGSWGGNVGFEHSIADLRIYETAIPDSYIQANHCQTRSIEGVDDYYDDLLAYWPLDDQGSYLEDQSGNDRPLTLQGGYTWESFSVRAANICATLPPNLEDYVIKPLDAPMSVYNWYSIVEAGNFGLDAQIWNPRYIGN